MASVDFPFRFESRTIFRYFLPGVLAFCLFLPYIRHIIPFWENLTEIGQIGFGLFYCLAVGLILEIIVDSYARSIFLWLIRQKLFTDIFRLKNVEQIMNDLEPPRISVLPPELQLDISPANREVIWYTTAVSHMLVACAIVFVLHVLASLLSLLFINPFRIFFTILSLPLTNPIQMLFMLFSIFMGYTCLRGGMQQAILRNHYVRALRVRTTVWQQRLKKERNNSA